MFGLGFLLVFVFLLCIVVFGLSLWLSYFVVLVVVMFFVLFLASGEWIGGGLR